MRIYECIGIYRTMKANGEMSFTKYATTFLTNSAGKLTIENDFEEPEFLAVLTGAEQFGQSGVLLPAP